MPKKISLSKKPCITTLRAEDKVNVKVNVNVKFSSGPVIMLSRRYLNGYHYWVDSNNIIYDDEENDFSRMGCIEESGEFCWD